MLLLKKDNIKFLTREISLMGSNLILFNTKKTNILYRKNKIDIYIDSILNIKTVQLKVCSLQDHLMVGNQN